MKPGLPMTRLWPEGMRMPPEFVLRRLHDEYWPLIDWFHDHASPEMLAANFIVIADDQAGKSYLAFRVVEISGEQIDIKIPYGDDPQNLVDRVVRFFDLDDSVGRHVPNGFRPPQEVTLGKDHALHRRRRQSA